MKENCQHVAEPFFLHVYTVAISYRKIPDSGNFLDPVFHRDDHFGLLHAGNGNFVHQCLNRLDALADDLHRGYGFMESYLAGYEYWSEESSGERREIYETLKSSSASPFAPDWNATLEKT